MAIFYGLLTAMAFGIGDFIAGKITKKVPTSVVVLYAQGIGVLIILPVAIISDHSFTGSALLWGTLGGIALGSGFLFYFQALSDGKMGIVSAVTGVSSALIPVLTGLAMGERPGNIALFGILLVILSIGLITKKESSEEASVSTSNITLVKSLCGGILIGLFFVFLHVPSANEGMWTVSFAMAGSFLIVGLIVLYRKTQLLVQKKSLLYMAGTGALQTFGTLTYVLGVSIGLMSIVALAGALSSLFTVLCARLFLSEKLTWIQIGGFVLAMLGISLLTLNV